MGRAGWYQQNGKVSAIDFKYVKKWKATENGVFSEDLYDCRASLALQYHFHIHFPRKILILCSLSFLKYLTLRLETINSN